MRFAKRVAELSGTPFRETVGSHTNLYVRLAMGQFFDASDPEWQQYVEGLLGASDQAAWTHRVHLQRLRFHSGPVPARAEGCFSYEAIGERCVRLHFHTDVSKAALTRETCSDRLRELASLFAYLKASSPDGMKVVGASWLYNLHCYRRLFPGRYLASLRPIEHPYQRMPLWGQFLRRDRTVRPEAARCFLAGLARAKSLLELSRCFPLNVQTTTAPATWFYDHLSL
ncbi:hypothetical protein [Caldimonas tepidiphila]|uniref:hypothetical protein n=1 Tax=Caldimonas tepidiphila TaxID=2315841 RepID=UPI001300BA13|nr:hypothetical protein [Caldimonas tepidiphila]